MNPNIEQASMRAASIEDRAKSIGISIISVYLSVVRTFGSEWGLD